MSTTTFQYRAIDKTGARRSGVASASSAGAAVRDLTAQGLTPVSIRPASRGGPGTGGRVGLRSIAQFSSQLSVLLAARVSISDVLLSIAEQEPDPRMRAVVLDLTRRIESGDTLSIALRAHVGTFGETYVETIRAAEAGGHLIKTLEMLSELIERQEETRRQVKGALAYPLIVLALLILGCGFLVGFIVPKFARMFAARGVELPFLTRLLRDVGDSVQSYWMVYLAAAAGAFFGLRLMWRRPAGREAIESALHRVPVIRRILPGLAIGRFVRVLGMSISAGIPLTDALEMAGRSSGRAVLTRDALAMAADIRSGKRLNEAMRSTRYLTSFTRRMLSAGEAAGELSDMCSVVARHYERETSHLTKTLAQAIEPVLIVGLAGMVLVVALAIFMPMWNMINLLG